MITTIIGQGFIWDYNTEYNLQVTFSGNYPPSVQKCWIVEGIDSSTFDLPANCLMSSNVLTVNQFTSTILNNRLGAHRVKI